MDQRNFVVIIAICILCTSCGPAAEPKERMYAEVESKLRGVAIPLANK